MFWKNKNFVTYSLKFYDFAVNDINCNYVWRCNKKYIIQNYKKNIGKNHLEIGPGTGYFLNNNYPINNLYLMDINNETLNFTKENLQNKYNNISKINHNIFEDKFKLNNLDSVGLNYVLHCVPGKLEIKIDKLINNLSSNQEIKYFGATVVNNKYLQTNLSRVELYYLNKYKIFNNKNDNFYNLISYFKINKIDYEYKIIGNVLIFSFEVKN
jgi:phospholipid N-methyltransferase